MADGRSATAVDSSWERFASLMVDQLEGAGKLAGSGWADAFRSVPRHHFVPRFYRRVLDEPGGWLPEDCGSVGAALGPAAWFARVYGATVPLTTAVTSVDVVRGRAVEAAISPAPAVLAPLLEALESSNETSSDPGADLGDKQSQLGGAGTSARVLELGTGCGYTTALLGHRFGAHSVVSVDIDPDMVTSAEMRLAGLGMRPGLVIGDATLSLPPGAWDRVFIGFAVDHFPGGWLQQLHPGALVVAELTGALGARRPVRLRRVERGTGDGAVAESAVLTGRFLDGEPARLAPVRHSVGAPHRARRPVVAGRARKVRFATTSFDAGQLSADSALMLLCQLHLPAGTTHTIVPTGSVMVSRFDALDGSWAEISLRPLAHRYRYECRAAGSTDLVQSLETAASEFAELGAPRWSDFGVTVTATETTVWHRSNPTWRRWPISDPHQSPMVSARG